MLIAAAMPLQALKPIAIYVSQYGNDHWKGSLSKPNRKRTDGPVKSVEAAQVLVRKAQNGMTPIEVRFTDGYTDRRVPIVFGPEDSGTAIAPITYRAWGQDRHSFSGKRIIQESGRGKSIFQVGADGLWRTTINDVKEGKWWFEQLFVNGERRYRARMPKQGYFTVLESLPPSPASQGKGSDRFKFFNEDIRPNWHNVEDIDVVFFHNWSVSHNRISTVESNTVTFLRPTGYPDDWAAFRKGDRYVVDNVREGLDQPGEWYLDRKSGELTYFPMPGEDPKKARVQAPVIPSLLEIRGDPANRKWVQHIRFQGLTFSGTSYLQPKQGRFFPQAEIDLPGTVSLIGARDIVFDGCEVNETGAYALEIGAACQNVTVKNCHFEDLGAGGVKIGETSLVRDPEKLTKANRIENCVIKSGGRLHPAAIGVWIGHSPYNVIKGNWIEDFYYTGISVGWSWGYGESGSHHNLIEGNTITQIGQGVLSDMGGVYLLGLAPGTVVRGNRISEIRSFSYGGWGLYTDEGSTGVLLEQNVVVGTKSAGFHQHYGKDNRVTNNIFAFGDEHQIMRTRAEDHLSFRFDHNIVVFKNGDLMGSNWTGNGFAMDHNVYWKVGGGAFDFAGQTWKQWSANGHDLDSVIADPNFVDSAKGNFSLKAGSPALTAGFHPFPALKAKARPRVRFPLAARAWP